MDLLTTVRKEGSRGGRGDFKWSDVQSSSHRENYLGHSLMAPVGRWQNGRDLGWYAKGDGDADQGGESSADKAERERREEIKRIKEAEQDALARALGYDVPPRDPNREPLGDGKEVEKILKEAAAEEHAEISTGVGYGKFERQVGGGTDERMEGTRPVTVAVTGGMELEVEVEVEVGTETIAGVIEDERETTTSTEGGLGHDRDHDHATWGETTITAHKVEKGRLVNAVSGTIQAIEDTVASLRVTDVMNAGGTTTMILKSRGVEEDDVVVNHWH